MRERIYRRYYLLSLTGVLPASAYPIYMGVLVMLRMFERGSIPIEDYPKYIIPYTPIAIAVILGVLIMPLLRRLPKRFDLVAGSVLSVAAFLGIERLMETKILVEATKMMVRLEGWQMSLCYVPPDMFETRTWEAVDVLLGGYSPIFKLHFYLISVVIIVSLLNCFYGFGKMIITKDYSKKKVLIIQAVTSVVFLLMCIWACFTAFYRTGELIVPPISAALMGVFFALLGTVMGVFAASFSLGKRKALSVIVPSVTAVLVTVAMYIGEIGLLNRHLYRFGKGFFFQGLGKLVLAPVDILIIAAAGIATAVICRMLNRDV